MITQLTEHQQKLEQRMAEWFQRNFDELCDRVKTHNAWFGDIDLALDNSFRVLTVDVSPEVSSSVLPAFNAPDNYYFVPHAEISGLGKGGIDFVAKAVTNTLEVIGRYPHGELQSRSQMIRVGDFREHKRQQTYAFEGKLIAKLDKTARIQRSMAESPLLALYWLGVAQGLDYRVVGHRLWQYCAAAKPIVPDLNLIEIAHREGFSCALAALMDWVPSIPESQKELEVMLQCNPATLQALQFNPATLQAFQSMRKIQDELQRAISDRALQAMRDAFNAARYCPPPLRFEMADDAKINWPQQQNIGDVDGNEGNE